MDELVKRLRECASGECFNCSQYTETTNASVCSKELMKQVADAIEELRKPKWIPVTERLPEDDKAVLAHVYWPEYGDTMICYGHWHKGWFHLFHHVEGELISGYVVTHWMPLPEPPKEET